MSKRRRTNPNNKFVMIERWFWRSEAWQALPHPARSLYIELELRFTGQNNGDIELSVRKAMELLGCSFNFTRKMFADLEAKGFIKARQRGSFGWKARHSTTWILTLHEYLGRSPTKDFMQWKASEMQKTDAPQASDRRSTSVRGAPKTPSTDAPQESEKPKIDPRSDAPQESVLVYHPVPSQKSEPESRAAPPAAGPRTQSKFDLIPPRSQKRFGPWLAARRNELGVQVRELADALGIRATDLFAIESGNVGMAVTMRDRALAYLRERAG
jgi:hypothetical protein